MVGTGQVPVSLTVPPGIYDIENLDDDDGAAVDVENHDDHNDAAVDVHDGRRRRSAGK